ncbi:Gustatory receptor 146b [Halyomorpha halys]|nr:Gustatory receptor 146b [Halyomorpha halys]
MGYEWFTNLLRRYLDVEFPWIDLLKLILTIAIATTHIIFSFFGYRFLMERKKSQVTGYFSFAHHINIPTCTFPAISALCLLIHNRKLSKIGHNICNIDELLRIRASPCNSRRSHYLFTSVLLLEFLYEFWNERHLFLETPSTYTHYLLMFLKWLVLKQFANRFAVIRFYYGQLSEHLNNQYVNKVKLVKCHEVLGCCCKTLWECYALQMTIFVVYSFITSVCYIYLVIDSYLRSKTLTPYHYVYSFWPVLYCSFIWLIVYSCAETKNMAKKFDKKLSQLIMNDVTNKLINKKRIIHHYKVKFKDFSAMGFFNFDYPLLLSMVSSTTTYIVILVQFSGRDD